jgi:hypothetical protein
MSGLMSLAAVAATLPPLDMPDPQEDENARPPRRCQVVRDEDYNAAAERWLEEENP